MNKKGMLMVYLLVFTVIAVSYAIYLNFTYFKDFDSDKIGRVQNSLIENSNNLYEELYFQNEILKYVVDDSVIELGNKGGFNEGERIDGYLLWYKGGNGCWPINKDDLEGNYLIILDEKMKSHSGYYFYDVDEFKYHDYDFKVEEDLDKLKIISGLNLSIDGNGNGFNTNGVYDNGLIYVLDYNFEDFVTKVKNVRDDILNDCSDDVDCWNDKKNSREWFKSLDVNGKVFKFELVSGSVGEKGVIVKGAVDFNDGELKC